MAGKVYQGQLAKLQIELVKVQAWATESCSLVAIGSEGRDAAGKGGTIKRFCENLNPHGARVIALSKPTEKVMGEWYFQRYIKHLPTAGGMIFLNRNWYNRGVVEHVFGFNKPEQREVFFNRVKDVEKMITSDGIHLFKFLLNVGREEQLRRFLGRESDPLKKWKLSWIDVEGLKSGMSILPQLQKRLSDLTAMSPLGRSFALMTNAARA